MPTKTQIQFIRSLQSRKTRDQLGVFVAETPKVVEELLTADNVQVQDVFATPAWAAANEEKVRLAGGNLLEIGDQMLQRLSSLSAPNQVIAVFSKPLVDQASEAFAYTSGFTLVLDAIQDPGNVGTIIRCADWFGVARIICGPGTADAFNPKVIQSTMGSVTRVPVIYQDDLAGWVEPVARAGVSVFAATLAGRSVYDMGQIDTGCLVIGNESRGISSEILRIVTDEVTIPRKGAAESLNAGVATGILLSHLLR